MDWEDGQRLARGSVSIPGTGEGRSLHSSWPQGTTRACPQRGSVARAGVEWCCYLAHPINSSPARTQICMGPHELGASWHTRGPPLGCKPVQGCWSGSHFPEGARNLRCGSRLREHVHGGWASQGCYGITCHTAQL